MNIGELQNKKQWTRTVMGAYHLGSGYRYKDKKGIPIAGGSTMKITLTQEDFANELNPLTHNINSTIVRSNRAVYKSVKDSKGRNRRVIDHYAPVSRVPLGLQEFICSTKVAHASGGIDLTNETIGVSDAVDKAFDRLTSEYDVSGMQYAWRQVLKSLIYTCDAAIYMYKENDVVKWQVFSHLKGDTLYPSIDSEGNSVFARRFSYQGKDAMQVFTKDAVEMWTCNDKNEEREQGWKNRWLRVFTNVVSGSEVVSEDGWSRVYRKANQVPNRLPITYFRIEDLPSAVVQSAIECIEDILSDFSEEAKMFAYQSMFIKGKVKSLPSPNSRGKIFAATGENDDAKLLNPSDSSDIVKILIERLDAEVFRTSKTVYLYPEIIKGSDVATASLKLLFEPQIQWCEDLFAEIFNEVNDMMELFKLLVGQISGKVSDFAQLRTSVSMNVWIPQNEKELVEITTAKVYAELMSRKAGRTEIGNKYPNEEETIAKEQEAISARKGTGSTEESETSGSSQEQEKEVEPNVDNNSSDSAVRSS